VYRICLITDCVRVVFAAMLIKDSLLEVVLFFIFGTSSTLNIFTGYIFSVLLTPIFSYLDIFNFLY